MPDADPVRVERIVVNLYLIVGMFSISTKRYPGALIVVDDIISNRNLVSGAKEHAVSDTRIDSIVLNKVVSHGAWKSTITRNTRGIRVCIVNDVIANGNIQQTCLQIDPIALTAIDAGVA